MKLLTAAEYQAETGSPSASTHVMIADDGEWLADVSQSDHDDQYWTILAARDHGDLVSFQCPYGTIWAILLDKFPGR
jgi:hypothetical protein